MRGTECERLEISFKKISEIPRETLCKDQLDKGQKYPTTESRGYIKKEVKRNTQKNCIKDLHEFVIITMVVTHLEPDILEYEGGFRNITTNKAVDSNIPPRLNS